MTSKKVEEKDITDEEFAALVEEQRNEMDPLQKILALMLEVELEKFDRGQESNQADSKRK